KGLDPAALFLAALAFSEAGQGDRAQAMLTRGIELAPSALGSAFAPDPAVAVVNAAVQALGSLGVAKAEAAAARARLASALLAAGRRGAAMHIAEGCGQEPAARGAALRV